MEHVYKFVSWEVPALETLKKTKPYIIMEKLNKGEVLTRKEKNYFQFYNGPHEKCLGWLFDFKPFCKRYLVHYKYDEWKEIWHFDKTAIRKSRSDAILEIIEIPVK